MVAGNVGDSMRVTFRMSIYLYCQVNGKNRKTDERVSGEKVKEYQVKRLKSIRENKECSTSQRNTAKDSTEPYFKHYLQHVHEERNNTSAVIHYSIHETICLLFVCKYALSQPRLLAKIV